MSQSESRASTADAIERIFEQVRPLAIFCLRSALQDANFRARVRDWAQEILIAAQEPAAPEPAAETEPAKVVAETTEDKVAKPAPVPESPSEPPRPASEPRRSEPLPPLRIGSLAPREPSIQLPQRVTRGEIDDSVLPSIAERCRVKATAAEWAAERQKLILKGASFEHEIDPRDKEIIREAKRVRDCFLWTNNPNAWVPPDDLSLVSELAGAYTVLAEAVTMVKTLIDQPDQSETVLPQGLELMAEAQSALRTAVSRVGGATDNDQNQAFQWLRNIAETRRILIRRYMRVDDPAEPRSREALREKIRGMEEQFQGHVKQVRDRKKRFDKLAYETRQIAAGNGDVVLRWETVTRTIDELVSSGIPASNREFRDHLLPLLDELPDLPSAPENFFKVITAIEQYLSERPSEDKVSEAPMSPEVKTVAQLLSGRKAVLIGGDRRPGIYERLKRAFGLGELEWVATRPHESVEPLVTAATRSDVDIVFLAIRWASHSYGELQTHCQEAGVPFVRLPAGLHPNQVAVRVLDQCGDKLRARA